MLSVEKIAAPDQYVYNLTVEDTHCYFAAGVLVSNCHNSKGIGNVISSAVNSLSSHAFKTLQMTGTLINGMASSLFQILYRSSYKFRQLYEFGEIQRFINKYGLYEQITKEYERHIGDYASGPKKIKRGKSERPGIAPAMVAELLPMTAFISLRDLEFDMVSYQENTLFVDAPAKLHTAVTRFLEAGKGEAAAEAYNGNYTPMGQLRAARLCTTNLPFGPDSIGTVSYCAPDLPDSILFPKEEALVRLILDAKNRGRKVMVFTGQIKARDPTPRLLSILERYGLKGVVMRAKVKKRVPFLEDALKNGADAVFCSPGLVSEGIDLPMFSTAVWYSPNYSAFITPQANRRFWRLNQE
ncbi:MAG: hypothetical protein KAX25_00395, partial [Dehalococcoidia bacterium]|nr:hypothetical protein [Dehalococcoidia bacterium]